MNDVPDGMRAWRLENLYRNSEPAVASATATSRILDLISGTENGHFLLSMKGLPDGEVQVRFAVSGADDVADDDVEWIFAPIGHLSSEEWASYAQMPHRLQELVPTVDVADSGLREMAARLPSGVAPGDLWPRGMRSSGIEILRALANGPGEFRVHLAAAPSADRAMAQERLLASGSPASSGPAIPRAVDPGWLAAYVGRPVEIRCMVGGGHSISPRLRAALLNLGVGTTLVERNPASREMTDAWRGGRVSMRATALPVGAAQSLFRVPASPDVPVICGMPVVAAPTGDVAIDDDVCRNGLRLGTAMTPEGRRREVRISEPAQLLHTEIIGATGTGKSSLLTAWVGEAARAGMGVSVIDPHGTLVNRLIAELPQEMASRAVVVRSGDLEHPVPVNPLNTDDHDMMQDTMNQVLRELLDPRDQGFMGPVFEQELGMLMDVQRALVGSRATFQAVPEMIGSKTEMRALLPRLPRRLAQQLVNGLLGRTDSDFADFSTWFISKFERMRSPAMSAIMASGQDAVDVTEVVDQRKLLFVDLASLTLGGFGSQLLGEMWLAKHWAAMARRADPSQLHLLVVDEAHLFGSGLLPRILAEGRKFGLGAVLAHQNLSQLTGALSAAVESTTSNVIAFRSGIREAASVDVRLGSWPGGNLTRLPAMRAATTLSDGPSQSDPFTLEVDHNARTPASAKDHESTRIFLESSWAKYSDPYRDSQPLTHDYFMSLAHESVKEGPVKKRPVQERLAAPAPKTETTLIDLLDRWWAHTPRCLSKGADRSARSLAPDSYDRSLEASNAIFSQDVFASFGYPALTDEQLLMLCTFATDIVNIEAGRAVSRDMTEEQLAFWDKDMQDPGLAKRWVQGFNGTIPQEIQALLDSEDPADQAHLQELIRGFWLSVVVPDHEERVIRVISMVKLELRGVRDEVMARLTAWLG